MTESKVMSSGITRRTFVGGAAAMAALGVLGGCSATTAGKAGDAGLVAVSDQVMSGVCRGGCATHCGLDVHVRDGQVVRTKAAELSDPRYNRICSKGMTHAARVYSGERLQYPMRRTGERGEGEFERISWDEAIDEIAQKWTEYAEAYGPASVLIATNSGNCGMIKASMTTRMQNVLGMGMLNGCYDQALSYAANKVTGSSAYAQQNETADWPNAKTFICWGADTTISTPQNMHFILDAKENGAKYIVIDTMFNANVGKADKFIPVQPSTDGALAFGALNHLLDQGWEDEDFIRASTEAPLFVKADGKFLRMSDLGVAPTETQMNMMTGQEEPVDPPAVWDEATGAPAPLTSAQQPSLASRSEVNGIPVTLVYDMVKKSISEYPVEKASEYSGVPVDEIKELARTYAEDGPVSTFIMFGPDHYLNGHYNYWPMYMLSAFTGNIAKPGAGLGYTMSMGSFFVDGTLGNAPVDKNGNPAQGAAMVNMPKGTVSEVLETRQFAGEPYELKSVYITGVNPLATSSNRNDVVDWMKKLDFVVVSEMVMSETAKYADILLPVCHWFETTDFGSDLGSTPFFMLQEQCLEPQFESKSDFEITKLIAERMGYGDFFDFTIEEYADMMLDTDSAKAIGASWENLKREKNIKHFPGDKNFISFEGGVFATSTGKFKLYEDNPTPWYYVGQDMDMTKEVLPYWEPAKYAYAESAERKGDYPFYLFSQHMRTRTHTQWWDVDYVKVYEPEPVVQVNPEDAKELGIAEGDKVRLYNDFGDVTLVAAINAGLPRKMLASKRSFHDFEYIDGHLANLSCSEYNQMIPNSAFNDVAVAIEKVRA